MLYGQYIDNLTADRSLPTKRIQDILACPKVHPLTRVYIVLDVFRNVPT